MKKVLISLFFVLCFGGVSIAQVLTVSNTTNSPGQFTNLQDAIDAANSGDTIYVHGSPTNYGTVTVNKRLTIIGPGFNAQGQFTTPATIITIFLDAIVPSSSATGSKFIGLNIGRLLEKSSEQFQIDSIIIERCRFFTNNAQNYVLGNNWVIRNNLFEWTSTHSGHSLNLNFYNNIVIANNIFNSPAGSYQIRNSNKNSVIITNNLFLGHYVSSLQFLNISNAVFANNIFFGKSPFGASTSVFENNLTWGEPYNSILPYGDNTGINNFVFVNPEFEDVPAPTSAEKYLFSYDNDYRLKPTSPGKNAGTDGTDIGIFGGPYPMPLNNGIITGEPYIPQIYYMHLQNNVIDQNTPINVTIKVRSVD